MWISRLGKTTAAVLVGISSACSEAQGPILRREAPLAESHRSTAAATPSPGPFEDWVSSYQYWSTTKQGDTYYYFVDILLWDELPGAEVDSWGWHESSQLMCGLHFKDPDHLELVFEEYGPADKSAHPYHPGDVLITLTKENRFRSPDWGALQPIGEVRLDQAKAPDAIPDDKGWTSAYPRDFIDVPSISARLDKLLGDDRRRLNVAFHLQSPARREKDLVFLDGRQRRDNDVSAGIAYDVKKDTIYAFVSDPSCKRRLDVWSESAASQPRVVSRWLKAANVHGLPVRVH